LNHITEEKAKEILARLIELRDLAAKDKSYQKEYDKYEAYCSQEFDYLVVARAGRYKSFSNYNDLIQDGRIALLYALRNFDLGKGSFFWWVNQYVKTKLSREANRHSTIKIPIKHAKAMVPHKMSQLPVMISTENPESSVSGKQTARILKKAIDSLSPEQKMVLDLNAFDDASINKISKTLKMSNPNCSKLLDEAKKSLRNKLESLDFR